MPGWDDDSPVLRANLAAVARQLAALATNRTRPNLDHVRHWHRRSMQGLTVPHPSVAGNFRGQKGEPYGIPPIVTLRPRPGGDYGAAAASAMRGELGPTIAVFQRLYDEWAP